MKTRGLLVLAVCTMAFSISVQNGKAQTLEAASPESVGIRSEGLADMSRWVREEKHNIRSMVVLRRGSIAMEWYAAEVTRNHNHNTFSITKSVVSALCGIAIQERTIRSPDTTLGKIFTDISAPAMAELSLHHLLTMQSGLPESRGNRSGPSKELFNALHNSPARLRDIFALTMSSKPGTTFAYGNIEPQLVVSAVEESTKIMALNYANSRLFEPLNFKNVEWKFADKTGSVPGGYGLHLRAIDLAKLGQLYLQNGRWGDHQILSRQWVEASTANQTGTGYGYYWWLQPSNTNQNSFTAKGVRGQQILVIPEYELVFVVTADLAHEQVRDVLEQLNNQLLRALITQAPGNPN